jgi:aminomethyltransferase
MRSAPYQALRESAAWIHLAGRGVIYATGADRARLLHAMTTNHIQQLQPGQCEYAFFLNAQGRILADVNVVCTEEAFLLDTEPSTRATVYQHLDRYIIADDVTLDDRSDHAAVIALEGPRSRQLLLEIGVDPPPDRGRWTAWNTWIAAGITAAGGSGYRFFVPAAEKDSLVSWLTGLGIVEAGEPELRVVRLENAHPRYGIDFSERYIPHETQLLHAIHFNKGCYLGQEIVERVRSRGLVNRKLVGLRMAGSQPPEPKTKITSEGKDIGEITSAAYSPALGHVVAMGYVRVEQLAANAPMEAAGVEVKVTAPQPS